VSSVVFMRAVNVGGHQVFRPSLLVAKLAHLGVVNVGAAGTFVVPGSVSQKAIRSEFTRRMSFEAEMMICRGGDVLDLLASDPFPKTTPFRRLVSVMSSRPAKTPALPLCQPAGTRWEAKVIGVSGLFAFSLWRRLGKKSFVEPNGVVEKGMGVRATTRSWSTMVKIGALLEPVAQRPGVGRPAPGRSA